MPNEAVLSAAGCNKLSLTLLQRQLLYFGRVARMSSDNPVRRVLLQDGSIDLRTTTGRRGRGRPRQQWGPCVRQQALQAAGSRHRLETVLLGGALQNGSEKIWRDIVYQY